jgi:zinc finger-containing ubiquitin peptidase 1
MMASYIISVQHKGADRFGKQLPSIFQIQDWIEAAWDLGINAQGRIETGGIKGTRKYIGTPEAQALLCSFDIPYVLGPLSLT